MSILLVRHDSFFAHDTGVHPERIERLHVIGEALERADSLDLRPVAAREATRDDILRCHDAAYYEAVSAIRGRRGGLDPDTLFGPDTLPAVLHAAGAGLSALDVMREGGDKSAFLPVRPPGHHAMPHRAMGFCFFNNIAITARYAQARHGYERVAIVDWDVHHGNGTQHIFYRDSSVYYYSLHLYPHFPGTGDQDETGAAAGSGTTLNRPLPHGFPAEYYVDTFRQDVAEIFESFSPDLLLVSAGFDSHRDDPLGGLMLTEESYRALGAVLREKAGEKPIISFLEGGYNLSRLGPSVVAHLEGIAD